MRDNSAKTRPDRTRRPQPERVGPGAERLLFRLNDKEDCLDAAAEVEFDGGTDVRLGDSMHAPWRLTTQCIVGAGTRW